MNVFKAIATGVIISNLVVTGFSFMEVAKLNGEIKFLNQAYTTLYRDINTLSLQQVQSQSDDELIATVLLNVVDEVQVMKQQIQTLSTPKKPPCKSISIRTPGVPY